MVSAKERHSSKQTTEELTGIFDRVTWTNQDGSFFFGRLQDGVSIAVTGRAENFINGVEYTFGGRWENKGKGMQFRAFSYIQRQPVTAPAIASYLNKYIANVGCGIGSARIQKMIDAWGAPHVVQTIKRDPKEVSKFLGIPYEKVKRASEILLDVEKFEETRIGLISLFEGRGFSGECIDRCIDAFGVNAVQAIQRNPFTLLVRGFPSCGFARVNALYEELGLSGQTREKRKREVIYLWHFMKEGDGSIWYEAEFLSMKLKEAVARANPVKAMKIGIRAKWLASKRDSEGNLWLATKEDADTEWALAKRLSQILSGDDPPPKNMEMSFGKEETS